jgi:hypothetical protein
MKEVTKEMRDKLRAPLPAESIKPHPTKTYLSSIKAIYVVERLNDVFGVGAFNLRSETVEKGANGTIVTKTTLTIPDYGIHLESYGGNDNGGEASKNFDLGDAYKGSVTDAITKICSYLEIGIDVFKGKSSPPVPKPVAKPLAKAVETAKPAEQKETIVAKSASSINTTGNATGTAKVKPSLTPGTKDWTSVVTRIKNGIKIEKVKEFFEISKENEDKLIAEAK